MGDHMRLKNKAAIITGGGGGIGRATALRFIEEGARVMISDINEEEGLKTLSMVREKEERRIYPNGYDQSAGSRKLMDRTIETFGRIDVCFNNAV